MNTKSNLLKSIFISLILLVGATNAWAYNQSAVDLYFDNSEAKWNSCYVYIGHSTWTSCYPLTRVSGTQYLWKLAKADFNGGSTWNSATGWVMCYEKWWDSNGESIDKYTWHGAKNVTKKRTSAWSASYIYKTNGTTSVTSDGNTINAYNTTTVSNKNYTVTINTATGGTLTVKDYDNNTVSNGASKIYLTVLKFSASASTGYTFDRVEINNGSTTTTISAADIASKTYTLTSNVTITPIWTPNTYTITFDKEGGTGGTDNVTVQYKNNNYTVNPVVVPTRTGYTFGGYWVGDNGTGVLVVNTDGSWKSNANGYTDANGNWAKTTDLTLYAKWTPITYAVTFGVHSSGNGALTATAASNSISSGANVNYGSNVVFTATPNPGYQIEGWYSDAACSNSLNNGTNHTYTIASLTAAANVYVKFEQIPATAHNITYTTQGTGWTYDANNPTSADEGERVTFTVTPATGYTVNVTADVNLEQSGNDYTFEMPGKDVAIKVSASPNTYTVTLDNQGATTAGTANVTATYNAALQSITAPTKTGYTFGGYYTATDGGGTQYYKTNGTSAKNWTETSVTKLYAKWTANTYSVKFNANGGTGTMSNQSFTYDETKALTANAFTRKGYDFAGWATSSSGAVQYTDGQSVSNLTANNNSIVNLYAVWTEQGPITVYFRPKTDWKNSKPVIICDGNTTAVTPYGCSGDYYTAQVPATTEDLKFGGNNETTLSLTIPQDDKVLYDMTSTNITKLYLKANSNWKADGARFAAYFFGNGEKWVSMAAVTGQTDLYEVTIPTDKSYPSVIFCRMNGGNQTNGWSNKWNQTADLTVPTDGTNRADLPTDVKDGATVTWHTIWDNSRWTTYTPSNTYTITLDRQGGTTGSESVEATLNAAAPNVTMPERTGYTFNGYYTAASEGIQIINAEGEWINGTNYVDADGNWISTDCNITFYAQWTEKLSTITIIVSEGGSVKVDGEDFVSVNTVQVGVATSKTITLHPNPGYGISGFGVTGDAWIAGDGTYTLTANSNEGRGTLYANFIALTYTITWDPNGGIVTPTTSSYTYNGTTVELPTPTRDGFTFVGWFTEQGTQITEIGTTNKPTSDVTYYAHWQGAAYTVTLDQEGAAKKGSTTSVVANFEGNMPAITGDGTLPTAPNGYAFMGYWDKKDGQGTQYYNADGTSAHVWDKTEDATLYAYFKKAEITINLNAASFEPNSATPAIATATITPTPVGTTSICWELLYNDDTPVAEHDPQETGEPNQVQFNINDLATGTYQIKATLREGAGCTGTIISHATQVFTITSDHTITIKYVDENGQTIKASTTQSAHVSSLTEITATEIIGYTFKEWEAGDGVSIKDATDGKKNTATIEFNAYYDGYLKAIYTKNSSIIYFYNTLGWENVYVYFYSGDYWNESKGSGAQSGGTYQGYAKMTQIAETNIWYVNASDKSTNYLVFGKDNQDGYENFYNTEVVRRGDYNKAIPMFVPIKAVEVTKNGTKYYNHGYWMNYPENTGYTLDLFNHHSDNDPARYFIYPYSKNTIFPLQLEVEINAENVVEGNKKIWFRIHRNDGKNFGGDATNFRTVNPTTTGGFIAENDYKVELITPIAGTYTFTLDYTYNEKTKDYQYRIDVDYPAKVGDYRILYKDEAETNWSGNTKPDGWYHPSRVIKKGEDRKDIISFYINKDVQRRLSYQTIKSIDNTTGAITWNTEEVQFNTIDWSKITKSGVYNFTFVQDGKGISVENDIVPYEGNYYIRTDAMAGGWEDYKTNSENRMTYSSFSESDANSFGEKFSHYAVKWCKAGTNVKFTIANDYSQCISDTLAQDIIPLGNLTDEGTLLNNDIYDANIRFMWNWKTNKISRAYVGPAGDKQSQFLMLQSCSEFKDAVGNDLNPTEGDILDKGNGIYAARFADTQNWIYERTIQVKPRTRVKLYASYPKGYHIYVENNTGWSEVALYAFKDGGDQPLGNWPGMRPAGTVVIEGKTYYDFPVKDYVFGSKLIFNNNVKENGKETNNFPISNTGDYYLTASKQNQLSQSDYVQTTVEAKAQYFRGEYAEGSCENEHTIQILGGEGESWNTIRVIYDFKTNRLMAAWMPNNNEIDTLSIESDVMIIRDHQNAAQCITFANDSSKLTDVKTVYGVMRFNRWILNNRGGEKDLDANSCGGADSYDEKTTNQNHPVLDPANQKSQYERALYFISFPFDVHLSDVFGFGTYGQHWIIEYYDGLKRAREGYWIDSDPNWKYVTNPTDFVLKAYEGYILCLNLGKMAYNNTDFWAHNISQVELFFPSVTTMKEISKIEVTMPSLGEEYLCKINRGDDTEGDRRVKDSYWRCIGVPSYANYSNVLKDEKGNPIKWQTSYKTFPFLYKWNKTDNTLTPQSTTNFKFETMHAYLVQNGGEIHWSAVSATPEPASIVARKEAPSNNYEWKITLTRNEQVEDQAFIRLSNDEKITNNFDFNQDLSKEFNYGRSDIYTLIGYEKAAANSLPISEQTTVIPLGLSIEYNGDYTLAMPDRVNGIGVTLIDSETGTRTNLSAGMDYTLTLNKGDYNNRFYIEISPVQQVPTDIEYVTGDTNSKDTVRKVLIDNILYIVRDGQIFDARGARVK